MIPFIMEYQKEVNSERQNTAWCLQGLWEQEMGSNYLMDRGFPFGVRKIF